MFCVTYCYNSVHLFNQLLLLIVFKMHVPLGQTGLARTVLDQDEPDLQTMLGECEREGYHTHTLSSQVTKVSHLTHKLTILIPQLIPNNQVNPKTLRQ